MSQFLKVGIAQMSPVWLNKQETISKIKDYITDAAKNDCELVVFGEAVLPGYPFWLSITDGSSFESKEQKEIHAYYIKNAIQLTKGDLDSICKLAVEKKIAIYLGIIERAEDRGAHSLYCSLVYINQLGEIKSVHRKLQPTYEERLTWAQGDGHGLQVHHLNQFTVGGLNCWENWMPLARTALYSQGENLHVAVWPGEKRNTEEITRFIAKESRSYVISASSLMRRSDIPKNTPNYYKIIHNAPEMIANGGSCIADPTGNWLVEPVVDKEQLITATLDFDIVLQERQNFDPSGHYSRPSVTKLIVNRERQSVVKFID